MLQGLVDYALSSAGGRVIAHSRLVGPLPAWYKSWRLLASAFHGPHPVLPAANQVLRCHCASSLGVSPTLPGSVIALMKELTPAQGPAPDNHYLSCKGHLDADFAMLLATTWGAICCLFL